MEIVVKSNNTAVFVFTSKIMISYKENIFVFILIENLCFIDSPFF